MTQATNGTASMGQNGSGQNGSGKSAAPVAGGAPAGHAPMKVSEVLGEVVWLMSQSPLHKHLMISDLEWLVMTPALLQQFRLFHSDLASAPGQPVTKQPIGVVFWGRVSEEVEARLAQGIGRMRPQDWNSGDRLWVVELIAPFGRVGDAQGWSAEAMLADLKRAVFPDREIKVLKVTAAGKEVGVL